MRQNILQTVHVCCQYWTTRHAATDSRSKQTTLTAFTLKHNARQEQAVSHKPTTAPPSSPCSPVPFLPSVSPAPSRSLSHHRCCRPTCVLPAVPRRTAELPSFPISSFPRHLFSAAARAQSLAPVPTTSLVATSGGGHLQTHQRRRSAYCRCAPGQSQLQVGAPLSARQIPQFVICFRLRLTLTTHKAAQWHAICYGLGLHSDCSAALPSNDGTNIRFVLKISNIRTFSWYSIRKIRYINEYRSNMFRHVVRRKISLGDLQLSDVTMKNLQLPNYSSHFFDVYIHTLGYKIK